MEDINEIDLEKYYEWLCEKSNEIMILSYYESRVVRYSTVVFDLLLRRIRQDKPETEVYLKWKKHFENKCLMIEKEIEKIKDNLIGYSGELVKSLNYIFPNSEDKNIISKCRKVCFDVDLESFYRAVRSKATPKERIIKQFLEVQKYTYLDYYINGKPLQANTENKDTVLYYFAQDLAKYDFIKYLNDELSEEQTEEIRISEKSLAYKIMLLHELGFFELNEINKNSSIRAKAEFVHIITGENFDNIRKCLSELDKPKDTKSNNPRKYEDEVKQKIKSLQRF